MFNTQYNQSKRYSKIFTKPSLTDQSFKDECNIDFIISNFVRTGQVPESSMNFIDCTTVQQFEEAQMLVAEAKSNFEQLPAKVRSEFKNVQGYLEYISNPANLKDSYERGFIDRGSVSLFDVYPDVYASIKDDASVVDKAAYLEQYASNSINKVIEKPFVSSIVSDTSSKVAAGDLGAPA